MAEPGNVIAQVAIWARSLLTTSCSQSRFGEWGVWVPYTAISYLPGRQNGSWRAQVEIG